MTKPREQNKLDRIRREQEAMKRKMQLRIKIENKKEMLTLYSQFTI